MAEKQESQDLCFVDRQTYPDFVIRPMPRNGAGADRGQSGKKTGNAPGDCLLYHRPEERPGDRPSRPSLCALPSMQQKNRLIVGEAAALKARGLMAGDMNILVKNWPR